MKAETKGDPEESMRCGGDDPPFLNGRMTGWYTREWANMFA